MPVCGDVLLGEPQHGVWVDVHITAVDIASADHVCEEKATSCSDENIAKQAI